MKLKEKFPFYFLALTAVYFAMLLFSIIILIGPGLSLGIYEYPEFWIFAIIPFLPLIGLFAHLHSKKENSIWRLVTTILVIITAFEFVFIVLAVV